MHVLVAETMACGDWNFCTHKVCNLLVEVLWLGVLPILTGMLLE